MIIITIIKIILLSSEQSGIAPGGAEAAAE